MSWYKEGLSFGCTQCGKCCTGSPGYVFVSREEIEKMAAFLHISPEDFVAQYTRRVGNGLSLIEDPQNYDCVFLRDNKCQVYGERPKQCRTFPFWPENVRCREAWEEVKDRCEGIEAPNAPVISAEEIDKILSDGKRD
jgi:Fe-S-cluster containining protein